jgi:hypothetical protein
MPHYPKDCARCRRLPAPRGTDCAWAQSLREREEGAWTSPEMTHLPCHVVWHGLTVIMCHLCMLWKLAYGDMCVCCFVFISTHLTWFYCIPDMLFETFSPLL